MYCHDLEVINSGSNSGQVDFGLRGTSVEVILKPKIMICCTLFYPAACSGRRSAHVTSSWM